jgi:hypothetical protein
MLPCVRGGPTPARGLRSRPEKAKEAIVLTMIPSIGYGCAFMPSGRLERVAPAPACTRTIGGRLTRRAPGREL